MQVLSSVSWWFIAFGVWGLFFGEASSISIPGSVHFQVPPIVLTSSDQEIARFISSFCARNNIEHKPATLELFSAKSLLDSKKEVLAMLFVNRTDEVGEKLFVALHPPSVTVELHDRYIDFLRTSFSKPMFDPHGELEFFLAYVRKCLTTFKRHSAVFNSPYIALIQSSGSGKSKLLFEASRVCRVMYICMREGKSGYPRRTGRAIDVMFGVGLQGMNMEDYIGELKSRIGLCVKSARRKLPAPSASNLTSNFASEEHEAVVWNFLDVDEHKDNSNNSLVILVIDEARQLITDGDVFHGWSKFRLFRNALGMFARENLHENFFVVLLDTSSRIQNFHPSAARDPSRHTPATVQEISSPILFHPFVLRSFFDVFFKPLPVGTKDLTSLIDSDAFLKAGRPLVAITGRGLQEDLTFLNLKLSGGQKDHLAALSMVCCRVSAELNPHAFTSSEMAAENMATFVASDLERETMIVSYMPEPKLAMAASLWWQTSLLETHLLPSFRKAMMTGGVNAARSDAVAEFILVLACDAACRLRGKKPGECVRLVDVLEQLLPPESNVNVSLAIPHHLQGSYVAVAQVVKLGRKCSELVLIQTAERHCAFGFPKKLRQRGVDYVVTLITGSIAVLMIQVNSFFSSSLCRQGNVSNAFCTKMFPSNAFVEDHFDLAELAALDENCVRLYLQLGAEKSSASVKAIPGEENFVSPLQIFGLNARCLCPPVRDELRGLLSATSEIDDFISCQESSASQTSCGAKRPYPDSIQRIREVWPLKSDKHREVIDLSVVELKTLCGHFRVSARGNKRELVKRVLKVGAQKKWSGMVLMRELEEVLSQLPRVLPDTYKKSIRLSTQQRHLIGVTGLRKRLASRTIVDRSPTMARLLR